MTEEYNERKQQTNNPWFPKLDKDRRPEPQYSINQISSIVGKTVESVEFGFCQPIDGVHESEAIILHFNDGSILGIDTGSLDSSIQISDAQRQGPSNL